MSAIAAEVVRGRLIQPSSDDLPGEGAEEAEVG